MSHYYAYMTPDGVLIDTYHSGEPNGTIVATNGVYDESAMGEILPTIDIFFYIDNLTNARLPILINPNICAGFCPDYDKCNVFENMQSLKSVPRLDCMYLVIQCSTGTYGDLYHTTFDRCVTCRTSLIISKIIADIIPANAIPVDTCRNCCERSKIPTMNTCITCNTQWTDIIPCPMCFKICTFCNRYPKKYGRDKPYCNCFLITDPICNICDVRLTTANYYHCGLNEQLLCKHAYDGIPCKNTKYACSACSTVCSDCYEFESACVLCLNKPPSKPNQWFTVSKIQLIGDMLILELSYISYCKDVLFTIKGDVSYGTVYDYILRNSIMKTDDAFKKYMKYSKKFMLCSNCVHVVEIERLPKDLEIGDITIDSIENPSIDHEDLYIC